MVKHPEKQRNISADNFYYDKYDILNDDEINTVVELIDDSEAAFEIVKLAMEKGKSVVSANEKNRLQSICRKYMIYRKSMKFLFFMKRQFVAVFLLSGI
ncbi:hypothetical protein [Halpernia sp. GG3]